MSLSSFSSRREDRGGQEHAGGMVDLCVGGATVLLGLGLALVRPWIGLVVLVAGLALWATGTKVWERVGHHEAMVEVTSRTVRSDAVPTLRPVPAPITVQATTNTTLHGRHSHRERRPNRRQSQLL